MTPGPTNEPRMSKGALIAVVSFCVFAIVATILVTWVRVRATTHPDPSPSGPAPASPVLRR